MQFIDLAAQQARIREEIEARLTAILDHGKYVMGPEIGELEAALADFCGTRYALGCSSGTDALLMALMAHGVGPGDAVFTSPFTFIATAEVCALLRATPVFVDVLPDTFNLDPEALARAVDAVAGRDPSGHVLPRGPAHAELTPKGVITVDLFGLPADHARINAVARDHGLFVIEDAAQAFGGTENGRRACALAGIGCTSFFPAKPLGGYGDGGMCFTDDGELFAAMDSLRIHGKGADQYDNERVGINGRLDSMQAAVLLAKFGIFPEELRLRDEAAARYTGLLDAAGVVAAPKIPEGFTSAWAQYSVLARDGAHRDRLRKALTDAGIPTAVYYPKGLHLQTAFRDLGYRAGDFPVTEDLTGRVFSLPMHPYLREEDQARIAEVIAAAG